LSRALLLQGGRVIDPSQDLDGAKDVRLGDGMVVAVGTDLHSDGAGVHDVSDKIVIPGLIDLHTHVYWGRTSLGVDADAYARASAVRRPDGRRQLVGSGIKPSATTAVTGPGTMSNRQR